MSASIIRRGLELLSDDIKGVPGNKKQKAKKMRSVNQAGGRGDGVMDQISSNRQGVTRQVRRLQGRLGSGKSKATVKDKRIKSAVDEFRKKQKRSQLSKNLRYFMGVAYKAEQSHTQKILVHNEGRQARNRPDRPVRKQKEERSLFTEEQFQQFQKEYFGRTVEDKK
ncbi:ribosomal protein S19 binding protein 1 [Conger conger]|uniref:ribosomal protein S19 binding protein 1 n=1 Tax=Conger conger TaxID=82655 RepID=UPI002A5A7E5B|nr:ribosomal protein S19 binding protein 1 [Conger conger]